MVGAWLAARICARRQLHLQYHGFGEYFSNDFKELRSKLKLGFGGLDGCARWRKLTVTVNVKFRWGVILKGSLGVAE